MSAFLKAFARTRIMVAQDDIDHGKCACPWNCAVARAIRRVVWEHVSVSVSGATVAIGNLPVCGLRTPLILDLPKAVSEFIDAFDRKRLTSPIEFDLYLPTEAIRTEEQPQP